MKRTHSRIHTRAPHTIDLLGAWLHFIYYKCLYFCSLSSYRHTYHCLSWYFTCFSLCRVCVFYIYLLLSHRIVFSSRLAAPCIISNVQIDDSQWCGKFIYSEWSAVNKREEKRKKEKKTKRKVLVLVFSPKNAIDQLTMFSIMKYTRPFDTRSTHTGLFVGVDKSKHDGSSRPIQIWQFMVLYLSLYYTTYLFCIVLVVVSSWLMCLFFSSMQEIRIISIKYIHIVLLDVNYTISVWCMIFFYWIIVHINYYIYHRVAHLQLRFSYTTTTSSSPPSSWKERKKTDSGDMEHIHAPLCS